MNEFITRLLIFQVIIIIFIIFLASKLSKINRSIKLERRISDYALNSIKDNNTSYADSFYSFILNIIKNISKMLNKIKYFRTLSFKYDKYISYENKRNIDGLDYISIKFLISIIFLILNIVLVLVQDINLNIFIIAVSLVIGYYVYDIYLMINYYKYRKILEEDLLKAIIIMNNAFTSGKNIVGAITNVVEQLEGPIQNEFKIIKLDISYGLNLTQVFERFYERTKLPDIKYMSTSLQLLNVSGGDIGRVFDNIEKSINRRNILRQELNTLTASSMFMFRFLVTIPFVLVFIIYMLNNTFFNILFESIIGYIIFVIITMLFSLYIYLIKKVMKVNI